MKNLLNCLLLPVVCMIFGAVTVYAGDHNCCGGSGTSPVCKVAKSTPECTGHKDANCPHANGTHAKINSKLGNCPVSGEPAVKTVSYTYEGTTYHFCCKDCIKDFKANPAKFTAKSKS